MADSAALRNALAEYLGEDRFRKFVRAGLKHGELRFWQHQEWNRFLAAHENLAIGIEELVVALRYCELHGQELRLDSVSVFHGYRDFTDQYNRAMIDVVPYAAEDWSTEGMAFHGSRIDVWYCPACRAAKAEWESMHLIYRRPPAY